MRRRIKGKLVIGLAALVVAAFAGVAYAATQTSAPSSRQAFLGDVAKRLHVTPQQLSAALSGAAIDQLQAAVKAGRLTQAQANALEQRLKQNGGAPALPPFGLFGPPGGAPVPRLRAFPEPIPGPGWFRGAAGYLGLTDAQLFQALSGGKSLAQIASAKGKSVSGLERAMIAAGKTRLDKLVGAKLITAAQEKQILSRLSARIADAVKQKGFPVPKLSVPRFRFHGTLPAPPAGAVPPPYALPGAVPPWYVPPAAVPRPSAAPAPSA